MRSLKFIAATIWMLCPVVSPHAQVLGDPTLPTLEIIGADPGSGGYLPNGLRLNNSALIAVGPNSSNYSQLKLGQAHSGGGGLTYPIQCSVTQSCTFIGTIEIVTATPTLQLTGTESGAKTWTLVESGGDIFLRNGTDNLGGFHIQGAARTDLLAVDDVGNGKFAGSISNASGSISKGTTFTISGGCGTPGSLTGGATTGSFTAGQTSCAPAFSLPQSPNGWWCSANDITHPADTFTQTAVSNVSCILSATVTSGDLVIFHAEGY